VENLWRFTHMGADLALFSGGKGLRGPQSSGLILGRKDLIEACAFHACPRPYVGRPMKVGKEELVGLMVAVRRYLDLDHEALMRTYEDQVRYAVDALSEVPHVSARRSFPSEAGQPMPRAEITLDEAALKESAMGLTRDDLLAQLRDGQPSIALSPAGSSGVYLNPQTLEPGQERIIVERIAEILQA
jgi:seryl-tRNA(Sec) selenium transferase